MPGRCFTIFCHDIYVKVMTVDIETSVNGVY